MLIALRCLAAVCIVINVNLRFSSCGESILLVVVQNVLTSIFCSGDDAVVWWHRARWLGHLLYHLKQREFHETLQVSLCSMLFLVYPVNCFIAVLPLFWHSWLVKEFISSTPLSTFWRHLTYGVQLYWQSSRNPPVRFPSFFSTF